MLALPAVLGLIVCSAGQTVLLDFYGDRCPPCRAMDPLVQQLIAQGYPVQKINVEQRPEIARSFGVTSIPCFVMLVDGREVDRAVDTLASIVKAERARRQRQEAAIRPILATFEETSE